MQETAWHVLRRRWRVIVAVVVLVVGSVIGFTATMTRVYSSTATLVVNQPRNGGAFDIATSLQFYARTLVNLVGSPNVAAAVAPNLSFHMSPAQARARMSFEVVNETQLLKVTATDANPRHAQELANTWAQSFAKYAADRLTAVAPASISVADAAALPKSPVRPRPKLYAAVGFLLALLLGVGAAFLRERLDRRIRAGDHLTQLFGFPVLATLPRRGTSPTQLMQFREAVGLLRTNLQFVSDEPLTAIALTSSLPGEGKSTVVAELGRSFAALSLMDDAVLVVDADLRRPQLRDRLELKDVASRSGGLSTYLLGEDRIGDVVVEGGFPGLRFLPPGRLPPNPSTLFGFASSRAHLRALGRTAEVLIFDTPPVSAGADAPIIATAVDGVVVVVDPSKATIDSVKFALEQLERVSARMLGFVVNNAKVTSSTLTYYQSTPADPTADVPARPLPSSASSVSAPPEPPAPAGVGDAAPPA